MPFKRTFILGLSLVATISAARSEIIKYRDSNQNVLIGTKISYLIESETPFSFDIPDNQVVMIASEMDILNIGTPRGKVWLKFEVLNGTNLPELFLEIAKPSLDYAEVFDGTKSLGVISDRDRFSLRRINDPHPIFKLPINPGQQKEFFVLLKNEQEIILPIYIGSEKSIMKRSKSRELLFGVFLGLMGVMIMYNLFLFLSLRTRIYIVYVLNITILLLGQSSLVGFAHKYFWPNLADWPSLAVVIMPLLSIIIGVIFVNEFLDLKNNAKRSRYVILIIIIVGFVGIIATFQGHVLEASLLLNILGGTASLFVIGLSLVLARRGIRSAKFLLISWSFFFTGVILYVLKDLNVLEHTFFTNYSMAVGAALETVLLSFALADRINILKKEREESQRQMLEEMSKNQNLTQNLNKELERQVAERTNSLEITNDDLNNTLANLQATQSQLLESEKMASLGNLTAGIAHEINNPINFVSSNVEPLRNDLKDVLTILNKYQFYAENSSDPAIKEILGEAEEIDITYSVQEIEQLISGIEEGAKRTSEIVTSLKNFSRTDEEDFKKANINHGLKSTLTILKSQLGSIKLDINYGELPKIACQLGKLNQVFMNILDNSINAIQIRWGDSAEGELGVITEYKDGNIYISISDNGIGISEEIKKNIFDPFYTTKDVGEGTGLGLSISYSIVEQHGGNIDVSSTLGEGSTFIIRLPENREIHE